MKDKHGDFVWYELLTSNPAEAQRFYAQVLGWTYTDGGMPGADYQIITKNDLAIGGVMKLPDGAPMPPCWNGYISADNVDTSAAAILKAGGSVLMEAQDIPDVGRFAFVADPQGAMFYLFQSASDEASKAFAGDEPMPGHCAWNELMTSDSEAALKFYGEQFGWTKDGEMDLGEQGKYQLLRHEVMIGAVMDKPPQVPVSLWVYYFRVADIGVAEQTIVANGGQILFGPQEVPGDEFIINALDPQGAPFAIVGVKA